MKLPKLLSSSVLLRETKSDQLKALSYKLKRKQHKNQNLEQLLEVYIISAYAGSNSSIVGFPAL